MNYSMTYAQLKTWQKFYKFLSGFGFRCFFVILNNFFAPFKIQFVAPRFHISQFVYM